MSELTRGTEMGAPAPQISQLIPRQSAPRSIGGVSMLEGGRGIFSNAGTVAENPLPGGSGGRSLASLTGLGNAIEQRGMGSATSPYSRVFDVMGFTPGQVRLTAARPTDTPDMPHINDAEFRRQLGESFIKVHGRNPNLNEWRGLLHSAGGHFGEFTVPSEMPGRNLYGTVIDPAAAAGGVGSVGGPQVADPFPVGTEGFMGGGVRDVEIGQLAQLLRSPGLIRTLSSLMARGGIR